MKSLTLTLLVSLLMPSAFAANLETVNSYIFDNFNICSTVAKKENYNRYKFGINLLKDSPYGTSDYQANVDECFKKKGKDVDNFMVELNNDLNSGSFTKVINKGLNTMATMLGSKEVNAKNNYSNYMLNYCSKLLTFDTAVIKKESQNANSYNSRKAAIEYYSSLPKLEEFEQNIRNGEEDENEDAISGCEASLQTYFAGNINNSSQEIDNRTSLLKDYFGDREKKRENERNKVVNQPEYSQILCEHAGILGQGNDKNCDVVNKSIAGGDNFASIGNWSKFISHFVGSGVDDGHNGYLSINNATKEYCKNCMSKNFKTAILLNGHKKYDPQTKLGETFEDEVNDIIDHKEDISKNKAKKVVNKAWKSTKDKLNNEVFNKLTEKKLQKELTKTTELLQQMYHFKASIPKEHHAQLEGSFSCYNQNLIEKAIKSNCKNKDGVKEAEKRLEKAFGSFLGEDLEGNIFRLKRGGFEKAFEILKERTAVPKLSKDNNSCEEMSREKYIKAQQAKYSNDGTKKLADYILDKSLNTKSSINNTLKEKLNNNEITPMEFIAESFIDNIYNDKLRGDGSLISSYMTIIYGFDSATEGPAKERQARLNTIFKPLIEKKIIPLSKYNPEPASVVYKQKNGVYELDKNGLRVPFVKKDIDEVYRGDLKAIIMDQMLKMSKVDPHFYAMNFNKEHFNKTLNKFNESDNKDKYFSGYLRFGENMDPKNRISNDIKRFKDIQETSCKNFIDTVSKFSCSPSNNLKHFSRNDIDKTIKEIAKKNKEKMDPQEKYLTDIALGSVSCEHKSVLDAGDSGYSEEDQLVSLDDEIPPFAQSDMTARNRDFLGLPPKKSVVDNLSEYAKSPNNCEQVELAAINYDCKHRLKATEDCYKEKKDAIKDISKKNTTRMIAESLKETNNNFQVAQTNNDQTEINSLLKDNDDFSVVQGEEFVLPSLQTDCEDVKYVHGMAVPKLTNKPACPRRNQLFGNLGLPGNNANNSIGPGSNFGNTGAPVYTPSFMRNTSNDKTSDEEIVRTQSAITLPTRELATIETTNTMNREIIMPTNIVTENEPTNIINTTPDATAINNEISSTSYGEVTTDLHTQKGKTLSPVTQNANNTIPSGYQKIEPKQYTGKQFLTDVNANPDEFNDTIVDANGNEYIRKKTETHKTDFKYLESNTNSLNDEFSNVKNSFKDDSKKLSEIDKMEEKYKKLLEKKINALKTEVEEIKTIDKTPIVNEKEEETFIAKTGNKSTKKLANPGEGIANNIQNIGTTSTSTTGGGGVNNNSLTTAGDEDSFSAGRGPSKVGKTLNKTFGGAKKRKSNGNVGRSVSISSAAISSGDKETVSDQLNGYLKLVRTEGGTAIEQSQLIDIEYIEIPGKAGKIPHAVLVDEKGDPLRVPLDEEHVDKKVINKILKAHDKITRNAQQEHERILEQEVFLESLKKEIAMIQAQASADLEKIKNGN